MKNLLRLEELAQFLLCLFALIASDVPWWPYVLLAIGPDIGMLGYLVNSKVGALTYNVLHHKGVAVVHLGGAIMLGYGQRPMEGLLQEGSILLITGVILYGHASLDRIFGYGLKFGNNFQHTHMGWIGKGGPWGTKNDE